MLATTNRASDSFLFFFFFYSFFFHLVLAARARPPIKGYLVARGEREQAGLAVPARRLHYRRVVNYSRQPTRTATGRGGYGRGKGERVSAVFFLVPGDEWASEQGRKYIISPLMGTHFSSHNSVFKNREGRVKYDVVYSSQRHFYEPSPQYKGIDCYFKARALESVLSASSCQ